MVEIYILFTEMLDDADKSLSLVQSWRRWFLQSKSANEIRSFGGATKAVNYCVKHRLFGPLALVAFEGQLARQFSTTCRLGFIASLALVSPLQYAVAYRDVELAPIP